MVVTYSMYNETETRATIQRSLSIIGTYAEYAYYMFLKVITTHTAESLFHPNITLRTTTKKKKKFKNNNNLCIDIMRISCLVWKMSVQSFFVGVIVCRRRNVSPVRHPVRLVDHRLSRPTVCPVRVHTGPTRRGAGSCKTNAVFRCLIRNRT